MVVTASPAWAIDASGADILGLRLGMSEQDVTAQLAHQEFPATTLPDRCKENDVCLVTAETRDGWLRITLSGRAGARQLEYVFRGHGHGEPQKIQAAMTDRFGDPNQQTPMAGAARSAATECVRVIRRR